MGILDDAIREHLDLKRRHGAREAELKQLENEAFGPPSRPGEPDFPESAEVGPREETAEVPLEEPGAEAPAVPPSETPTELAPTSPGSDAEPAPPADVGAPGPGAERAGAAGPGEGTESLREPEPEGVEEPGQLPYDQGLEQELDLGELELELEEELALDDQQVAAEEATAPPPDEDSPAAEIPVDEVRVEEEWAEEPLEKEGEDDVLEETPEFLRDAPEDEELWFEQGEPQDFDFEDER
jgi:hypothetical protein